MCYFETRNISQDFEKNIKKTSNQHLSVETVFSMQIYNTCKIWA